MTLLYIDAFAGISGDMTVAALLSLGVPLQHLQDELSQLALPGYSCTAVPRQLSGIMATQFAVQTTAAPHAHRPFGEIRTLLGSSGLQAAVKRQALAIFTKLAEAEGRVHGQAPDDVEFHEVGATDSIVDIVGAAIGLTALGVEAAYVSPLPLGSGITASQHGPLPVPGPATLELLRGFITRPGDGTGEVVTPTGAAIVAAIATPGAAPEMRVRAVGYGAGTRVQADRPNVLRLVLGEQSGVSSHDEIVVIETNIDDCNPEFYDHVMDRLFEAGARDVYLTPVHMKKNRPGVVLTVLSNQADRERLANVILTETSAIGLRFHSARRLILPRQELTVMTAYGPVRVKVARTAEGIENVAPEYDDCRHLARQHAVPIKHVYQAALAAALSGSTRK